MKKIIFVVIIAILPVLLTGCAKDDQVAQLQNKNIELQNIIKQQVPKDTTSESQIIVPPGSSSTTKDIVAKTESMKLSADVDLQIKCSSAADKFFKANYSPNELTYYSNHWSNKLKKCFILVNVAVYDRGSIARGRDIYNVYENKQYGTIALGNPILCYIYSKETNDTSRECKSEIEFNEFVEQYMND